MRKKIAQQAMLALVILFTVVTGVILGNSILAQESDSSESTYLHRGL